MPRILACPHCQARMVVAHDCCRRCHRPIDGKHVDVAARSSARPGSPGPARGPTRTAALIGACVVVLAAVGAVAWPRAPLTDQATPSAAAGASQPAAGADSRAGDTAAAGREPIAAAPADSPAPPSRGDGYSTYMAGDTTGALAQYLATVERRPTDAAALNNVGQLLVELGRAGEAISYFERALATEPSSAMLRFNLAVACGQAGRWDQAIASYRAAAELDPRDARIAHNLGLALHKAGREDEAADAFRTATGLAPDQAPSWMGLAQTLDRLGQASAAADAYERLAAAQPNSTDAAASRRRAEQLRAKGTAAPAAPSPDAR